MAALSNPDLERWHQIVRDHNQQDLLAMLAENVVFRSPYIDIPHQGRETVSHILWTVSGIFKDFRYHRELVVDHNWALEFSARVDNQPLKGIDLIHLTEDHFIVEFEVFVRPLSGLRALGVEMSRRLG